MAQSGSVDFNMSRDDIVSHSMTLIGVKGVGRALSAEDAAVGNVELNMLIKHWMSKGYSIFGREEGVLFLQNDTTQYSLGPNSTDARATKADDAVVTELSVAKVALDTALSVDSTTDMAALDIIGIVQDDGTIHWTDIVSVDTGTTLTITTGLVSAAAIDRNVYTFTTRINKPLKIHAARRTNGETNDNLITTDMTRISHEEFFQQPNLTSGGPPTQFHYHPELTNGRLYLWPRPDDTQIYLNFTYSRQLDDVDDASDNMPLPAEWLRAVVYQLAVSLANSFGKTDRAQLLVAQASSFLEDALEFDIEDTAIFVTPGFDL